MIPEPQAISSLFRTFVQESEEDSKQAITGREVGSKAASWREYDVPAFGRATVGIVATDTSNQEWLRSK
jgi:hypothetical protein